MLGDSEFVMGFQLIGIRRIVEADSPKALKENMVSLFEEQVGIVITNDKSMQKLDSSFRRQVENSVSPIVVVLSEDQFTQNNLRDMIKKAIGIDLWGR